VHLVQHYGFDLETAVRLGSTNVAEHLCLKRKGHLKEGMDADMIVIEEKTLALRHVIAKGEVMMHNGEILKKGTYE
jgi:beta-aspartyl-dipeptidase (metallo-type)